jgi:hypothetical protein
VFIFKIMKYHKIRCSTLLKFASGRPGTHHFSPLRKWPWSSHPVWCQRYKYGKMAPFEWGNHREIMINRDKTIKFGSTPCSYTLYKSLFGFLFLNGSFEMDWHRHQSRNSLNCLTTAPHSGEKLNGHGSFPLCTQGETVRDSSLSGFNVHR